MAVAVPELRAVRAIKVGRRCRQRLGDIPALAASIAEAGLLHPIVITPNNRLIAGKRRLEAYRHLQRPQIPVTVVDLKGLIEGEYAENFFREAFTPSEMVAIRQTLMPRERQAAKDRQRAGGRPSKERPAKRSGKLPDHSKSQTRDKVAKGAGVSGRTLEKAAAENLQREDLSAVEAIEAIVEMVDAESIEDQEYATFGADPVTRLKTLLMKLDSDRSHGTDHYSNKFIGTVERLFANLAKRMTWQSFYLNDLPLVTTIDADVRQVAVEHRLNKSQAKELDRLRKTVPATHREIQEQRRNVPA